MASSFRAISSNTTAGATNLSVTKPAGTADGDLLYACIAWLANPGTITHITGGTTWLRENGFSNFVGTLFLERYWKIAGASEPSSYSWSWTTSRPAVALIGAYQDLEYFQNAFTIPDTASYLISKQGVGGSTGTTITVPPHRYEVLTPRFMREVTIFATSGAISFSGVSSTLTARDTKTVGAGPTILFADEELDKVASPYSGVATRVATMNTTSNFLASRHAFRDEDTSGSEERAPAGAGGHRVLVI